MPFFLAGAALYTSVGHGGATVYLAILTLAGWAVGPLRTTVLALNILAAGYAFFVFRQAGHLRLNLLVPFILTSVPMAFVGGLAPWSDRTQELVLGGTLLAAGLRFLLVGRPPRLWDLEPQGVGYLFFALGLGGLLGFLAGATGIGGGIFLSPVLVMLGWAGVREAASVASAFIVLNSAAGLAAQVGSRPVDWGLLLPLAIAVVAGAAVGSWAGARRLPPRILQVLLGFALLVAAARAFA